MKRSELLVKLQRLYHIRHCMVDGKYITPDQFMEEVLQYVEEAGMKPPRLSDDKCQALMHVYYGGYTCNQWDEDFEKDEKAVEALKLREEAAQKRKAKREN